MLDLTHLLFALALAYVLDLPVVYAMIGGVLPTVDTLFAAPFPFVPNGILHTPVFVIFTMLVLYLAANRTTVAGACGVGLLSHLYLDTVTVATGVMWLFPVSTHRFTVPVLAADGLAANLAVAGFSVFVLVTWRYWEVVPWTKL